LYLRTLFSLHLSERLQPVRWALLQELLRRQLLLPGRLTGPHPGSVRSRHSSVTVLGLAEDSSGTVAVLKVREAAH
jgi:hypothetical protein